MERPIRQTASIVLAALVALAPSVVSASGFYLPGRGVGPMGRAGASVASSGGDLNAMWYNPANLALLEDVELTIDTSMIGTFSTFQRAPRERRNGEMMTYDSVSNQAAPHPDPQLLVGGPTPVDGLSWGVGLFAPYGSHATYPQDGAQRYSMIDNSKSALAFLGAAVAYQIGDRVRIGAGFHNMIASFELVNVISGYTGLHGRPEDRELDILNRVTMQDFFAPTGNVGLWVGITDRLETAVSAQLPATFRDTDAEFEARMPSHPEFDNAKLSNNTVEGVLNMPLILRAALRYATDDFDVELTGVYEQWSVFEQITVNPNNVAVEDAPGIGSIPIGAMSVPQHWRDSFSVRLGGHYQFSDNWRIRAGYAFETGAVPEEYYSVFAPDPNKHLIGGGMRHDWGNVYLDASIGFYALETREIDDSKLKQINPIDAEDELATVVGNGTYKSNHLIVGTGVNWTF